jgi:hypothetical protein
MDAATNLVSISNRATARALLVGDRIDTTGLNSLLDVLVAACAKTEF